MKPRIIVSGASGWLGRTISTLANEEQNTIDLKTAGKHSESQLVANLANQDSVERLLSQYQKCKLKAEVFIHCAGLAHRPNETEAVKAAMWEINDRGTARALEFCERAGISRFIYVSTIAGYDWTREKPANETDLLNPKTEYAKSKLAGEERVLNAAIDGRAVRLATVFGSGDKANFLKLSQALKRRRFIIPGKGTARKSVISIDFAAELITRFAVLDTPQYQLMNLALPHAPQLSEICTAFSDLCKFPKPISLPQWLLKTVANFGDEANRIRPFPLTSTILNKLNTPTCVDTTRMIETFPDIIFPSFSSSLSGHSEYYRQQ